MSSGCALLDGSSDLVITANATSEASPITSPAELEDAYVRQVAALLYVTDRDRAHARQRALAALDDTNN